MAFAGSGTNSDRLKSGLAVLLIHLTAGYVLLNAFDIRVGEALRSTVGNLNVIAIALPPEVVDDRPRKASPNQEGAASPANIHKASVPREAPEPIVEIPLPEPVLVSPKAGEGNQNDAGAANVSGPGSGAGGVGVGFGSGRGGDGTGGGGVALRAKLVSGRITNADYPKTAATARQGGTVTAHFTIDTNGRANRCRIVKSSGNADIDATTCRLIEQRFRYEPARNKAGQPISDVTGWQQTWWLERGKRKFIRPEDDLPKPPPKYVPPPENR